MTRIDFYFNVQDKFSRLAELAGNALARERRLFVYVPDRESAERVGEVLYTHGQTSFMPHCAADHSLAGETPIIIDWRSDRLPHDDVLVNLCDAHPPFFSRFTRLIEIVGMEPADRQEARARFRFYRDRGYDIRSIDVTGVEA